MASKPIRLYFKLHSGKLEALEDAIEAHGDRVAKLKDTDPDDEADEIWEQLRRAGLRADEFVYLDFDTTKKTLSIVPHKLKKGKVKEK